MQAMEVETGEWLQKAYNDLRSARVLMRHEPPLLDTAAFHCQQATEKMLKGFLVSRGVLFEKVHSLPYLVNLCAVEDEAFSTLHDSAEALTPFAVRVRYPGKGADPTLAEAEELLLKAETLWRFVLGRLPAALRTPFLSEGV